MADLFEIVPFVIMESTHCSRCHDQVILRIGERLCISCKSELKR